MSATVKSLDPGFGLTEKQVRLPDGRSMRTVVAGGGNPMVIFEAGIGVCASTWTTVQRLVADQTRTLAYDRAGLGGSDDDSHPRSLDRIVADLTDVLDRVEPHADVVLVGASLGGAIIRLFALKHPTRLVGLVFVDAAVAVATPQSHMRRLQRSFALVAALSRVGLHKPLIRAVLTSAMDAPIPDEDRAVLVRDFSSPRTLRMAAREAREIDLAPALPQLEEAGLPDIPVTTIVGARTGRRELHELRTAMLDQARRDMDAHPRGRFVAAVESSHVIPQQQPGLVAEEILRIVRTVRSGEC